MLNRDKHFNTNDEKKGSNVLYQIEQLIKKYPRTIHYEDIINKNLKDT